MNIFTKIGDAVDGAVHTIVKPFERDAGVVFITGNGCLGHRVAMRLLKEEGHPKVRMGVRDRDSAAEINKQGAELVDFCWENEDTYAGALDGAGTVFCATPHHKGWSDHFHSFLMACKAAGVRHIVKVSFYHALTATRAHALKKYEDVSLPEEKPLYRVPLIRMHGECDKMLVRSNVNYTILSSSHLMSNVLVYQGSNLRESGKFYGASNGRGVNYVSPNDVAEVAVHAILSPRDHRNVGYTLTGPAAIKDEEVAELLGKFFSMPISYVDQSLAEFMDEEKRQGDPKWLVADLVLLEKVKASGVEEDLAYLSEDTEKVCARPPETYEEYLAGTAVMTSKELAYVRDTNGVKE